MKNTIVALTTTASALTPTGLSPAAKQAPKPTRWDKLLDFAKTSYEALKPAQERSNAQLYGILADCLRVYQDLVRDSNAQKEFRDKYKRQKLTLTKRSPLQAQIIRYVFKLDRRKLSAYARVIEVAHRENTKSYELSAWIIENGGIEEIRRRATKRGLPREQALRLAVDSLGNFPALGKITDADKTLRPQYRNFSLALLRFDNDSCVAVYSLADKSAVKNALVTAGRKMATDQDRDNSDKAERDERAKRAALVNKALVA